MGVKPSPCGSVKNTGCLLNLIVGVPLDEDNVFAWNHVVENLPGMEDYQPWEPCVSKRSADGRIAPDATDCVDDMRGSGPTREKAHGVAGTIAKMSACHGNQVLARKCRMESLRAGAWNGGGVGFRDHLIFVTVTLSRWDKLKSVIGDLRMQVFYKTGHPQAEIELEPLESVAGFINYVARTFPWLMPCLHGVHLQMNSWRPNQDFEGWKNDNVSIEELSDMNAQNRDNCPTCAKQIPRLVNDVQALEALTASSVPVERKARPMKGAKAICSFGDASGQFFGQAEYKQDADVIQVDIGKWTKTASSRGYIVMKVEELEARGKLSELAEVFIFTDNFVSEYL